MPPPARSPAARCSATSGSAPSRSSCSAALLAGFSYSGVALTLGQRHADVPLFTLGAALPDGFGGLKILRAVAWTFCGLGIVALLIPYRSPRWQTAVPIVVTGLFLALYGAIALANHHAWKTGLPYNTPLGTGIFRPDHFRIPGVLQHIAVCYGLAATIALFFGWRMLIVRCSCCSLATRP